ncbi:sel1 repeat family protein [Nonomuraea sp. K274]|uniref:Sel1 repeat family protein n=1 Tax=Nonomuraea cypriaca TaxID=1187855 RepID=A0A931ACL7_9ACTN|nr:tetratricopeptide repeat protein [Nonomuraea cypriaca]MBF8190316.1 sel1 repeat family protein [Nonomuraea cypriaca]
MRKWFKRDGNADDKAQHKRAQVAWETANRLFEQGNVQDLAAPLREAAELGHTEAMTNLGVVLHQEGRDAEAEQWWQRAARQGSIDSMYNLGNFCMKNRRVLDGERWLARAAEAGHLQAMSDLGVFLFQAGQVSDAKDLWTRAARQGNAAAARNLEVFRVADAALKEPDRRGRNRRPR